MRAIKNHADFWALIFFENAGDGAFRKTNVFLGDKHSFSFEPAQTLSHQALNLARLTTPAPPRFERGLLDFCKQVCEII